MKFFVYTVALNKDGDKDYEFVEEPALAHFATHEFDPVTMQYSGIAIEASDFGNALKAYNHPTADCGEFLMVDEPQETATRRSVSLALDNTYEKVGEQLDLLRCMLLMKLAAAKLVEANKLMNKLAEDLYTIYGADTSATPKEVFESISDNAIKHTIKYYGDSKKTG